MDFISTHFIRSTIILILIIALFGCSKKEEIPQNFNEIDVSGQVAIDTPASETDQQASTFKSKVIIDNRHNEFDQLSKKDTKGYQQFGTWSQSALKGYKDSISRYSNDPQASIRYSSNKVGESPYCVSLFKVTHQNSTDNARITIKDGPYIIYQKNIGFNSAYSNSGWFHLGSFHFTGEEVEVLLEQGQNSNGGLLRADALKFKKLKTGHDCYGKKFKKISKKGIIDNRHNQLVSQSKKDTVGYRQFGQWKQSSLPGFKNSISRYSNDQYAAVTYSAILQKDQYCLSLFKVTHPNGIDLANVEIKVNNQILDAQTLSYNHPTEEKGWYHLGVYQFTPGDQLTLKLTRGFNSVGHLRADAFKINSKLSACQ